jgi:hypothetical protein
MVDRHAVHQRFKAAYDSLNADPAEVYREASAYARWHAEKGLAQGPREGYREEFGGTDNSSPWYRYFGRLIAHSYMTGWRQGLKRGERKLPFGATSMSVESDGKTSKTKYYY